MITKLNSSFTTCFSGTVKIALEIIATMQTIDESKDRI